MQKELREIISGSFEFGLTRQGKLKFQETNRVAVAGSVIAKLDPVTLAQNGIIAEYMSLPEIEKKNLVRDILKDIEGSFLEGRYTDIGLSQEHMADNVIYCVNYFDGTDRFLTDKEFNVLDFDHEAWRTIIPKDQFDNCQKAVVKKVYEPYNPYKISKKDSYTIMNTCEFPEYRYQIDSEESPELNPLFLRLLDHLFKDKKSHDHAMAWYLSAIHNRNQVGLTMIGERAIGKSKFCETFPRMFGASNFRLGDPKAMEKEFNSFLDKSRIVLFDEVAMNTDEEMTRMKKYFNETNSIEKKGKDAETKQTFCSFVFSTNYHRNIKILSDERRFSCVDLTDTPLYKVMSRADIGKLESYIAHDPDFPLAFYRYIVKHADKDFNQALPYKGQTFYDAVEANLTKWQRAIFEHIEQGVTENFTLADTELDWEKDKLPDINKIKNFLANFIWKGERLGTVERARRKKDHLIVVNPKLLNSEFKSEL